jgi:hypothetical protein
MHGVTSWKVTALRLKSGCNNGNTHVVFLGIARWLQTRAADWTVVVQFLALGPIQIHMGRTPGYFLEGKAGPGMKLNTYLSSSGDVKRDGAVYSHFVFMASCLLL